MDLFRNAIPIIFGDSASIIVFVLDFLFEPVRRADGHTNGREDAFVGFFMQKNGSAADGEFTVFTGRDSMTNYAFIDSWNGISSLPWWKTDKCNEIVGTDGTAFPPDLAHNTTLYLYNPDLCRSLPLVFQKEVLHHGVASRNLFRLFYLMSTIGRLHFLLTQSVYDSQ